YGVTSDMVLAGNGSSELIWLACLAYLRPGDRAAIRQPTFGEYARSAASHGGCVARFDGALPALAGERMAFICNPNNPTGDFLPDLRTLGQQRSYLEAALRGLGYRPEPTDCNFFLVKVQPDARTVRNALLKEGMLVRDCTSFGLPNHIRLSVRPDQDADRLVR